MIHGKCSRYIRLVKKLESYQVGREVDLLNFCDYQMNVSILMKSIGIYDVSMYDVSVLFGGLYETKRI